ncbi:unnamed protein product [marine sediment metagenome]|uniref:Uncharacterized protein n=1 Tax=marine sediment metagenome TaxID=412755 RepID=X1AZ14_9ZZZZ
MIAVGVLKRSVEKYNVWDLALKLQSHRYFKSCKNKSDLMVVAQDIFPTMTIGEHKKIAAAYYIMVRKEQLAKIS